MDNAVYLKAQRDHERAVAIARDSRVLAVVKPESVAPGADDILDSAIESERDMIESATSRKQR